MSIIIEHMEMPNGCCECRMQTENCCTLSLRKIDDIFTRPTWCKLKEIDCKNCKRNGTWSCMVNHGANEIMPMDDDDFCSQGKRKESEE